MTYRTFDGTSQTESIAAGRYSASKSGVSDGSATQGAVYFADDVDTGFYSPANNKIALITGGTERLHIDDSGLVGIGGTPGTQLEINGATPYLTLKNDTHEDTEGGRESKIIFEGEQSGGEITSLAVIQASHDGTSDDEKGDLIFSVNDGNDGAAPSEVVRIHSTGKIGLRGADPADYDAEANELVITGPANDVGITIKGGSSVGDHQSIFFADGTSGGAEKSGQIRYEQNNERMKFYTNDTLHFQINLNGDLLATDTTIGSISDSRLKTNVSDYTFDLNKFKQIAPKSFDWINKEEVDNKTNCRGFLAQDLESIDSYFVGSVVLDDAPKNSLLVDTDSKGNKVAKTAKLGEKDVMYISVIKQLIAKIETLETKVAALEAG
jgi:hypothetical protein